MNREERKNNIISRLRETQLKSDSPKEFEQTIQDAFDFLGFETELISGPGDTDVVLSANIGNGAYKIIADGKTSSTGKISEGAINWDSLEDHKKKNSADFVVVVGPSFASGNLQTRADDHNVFLLKTDDLISLVEAHSEFPFTLTEIKNLFAGKGDRSSQLYDILTQNEFKRNFLREFKSVIDEMQSLQNGKLGYFTDASLCGREKLEDFEVDLEDIKSIIQLLELPFIGALESLSEHKNEYILTVGKNDLAHIFIQIGNKLMEKEESIIQSVERIKPVEQIEKITVKEVTKRSFGLKYYKWEPVHGHITAYARKDNPYPHNCPTIHLKTIMNAIINIFERQDIVNKDIIYTQLEGKELSPDRIFKGKPEQYKIYMALGILEIENLIKWTGSKRPVEYTLNASLDSIKKWIEQKIV
jgi:hypothetical protein